MSGFLLTLHDAGRAALVNAGHTGTAARLITEIGLSGASFVPNKQSAVLAHEFKRLRTLDGNLSGAVVAADMIHAIVRDASAEQYTFYGFGLFLDSGELLASYSQRAEDGPIMEKSPRAMMLLAIDGAIDSIDTARVSFGNTNFLNPPATTDTEGVVALATHEQTRAGQHTQRAVTPAGLQATLGPALAAKADVSHRHAILGIDGLQAALDAKLSKSGGELSGQLRLVQGSAKTPGLSFVNDGAPDTGLFHISDGVFGITNNAVETLRFSPTLATFQKPVTSNAQATDNNGVFRTLADLGGTLATWNGTGVRGPALQVDAPNAAAAYMGLRWTRWGGRHLAAIDAYEGGSASAEPSIVMHVDAQANAWTFGRTGITRGAGGTVWGSWNFDPAAYQAAGSYLPTSGGTLSGPLTLANSQSLALHASNGYAATLRADPTGLIGFINQGGTAWNMQLEEGGVAKFRGQVWAGMGGSARLCEDGNLYGAVWGGDYLSTWLHNQFTVRDTNTHGVAMAANQANANANGRAPIRNGHSSTYGYVASDTHQGLVINWDGNFRIYVDGTIGSALWGTHNLDPNHAVALANNANANAEGRVPKRQSIQGDGYVLTGSNAVTIGWNGSYNMYTDNQYQGDLLHSNNWSNWAAPRSSMDYGGVGSYTFMNTGANPGANTLVNLPGMGGTWRVMSGAFGANGKDIMYVRIG